MSTFTTPRKPARPDGRARQWLARGSLGVILVTVGLAGVGATYQAIATRRDARRLQPPGEMVDAGGYRLHLVVAGTERAGPTVILDAGLGIPAVFLSRLQAEAAEYTRVVAYDRPGIGWSDSPPAGQTHDALTTAYALYKSLENAQVPGPYVLVGHSAGGLNMLVFAATFPQETAGLVLLDSTHPDQFWRYPPEHAADQRKMGSFARLTSYAARLGILRLVDAPRFLEADELAPADQALLQTYFASPRFGAGISAELAAFEGETFPQVRAIQSLGDLPMVVLTAGATAEQVPVQVALHKEFAALSTNSFQQVVDGASHARIATDPDYLPAVHAAIRQVLDSASSGLSLARE